MKLSVIGREMAIVENLPAIVETFLDNGNVGNYRLSSYLVWVGVKFSNAKEEELLINDASQIGSKKFDFSIE